MAGKDNEWIEQALTGVPDDVASRYRAKASFLDRALQGIPEDVKTDALRVMVNLNIPADDAANILVVLYGHIRAAAETIPKEIRGASREFSDMLEQFVQETQIFPEVVKQVHERVAQDVQQEATEIGMAAVKAASIQEIENHKTRLMVATEEILKQYLENALKEKQKAGADVLVIRHRAITAIAAIVIFVFAWMGGMSWGVFHGELSAEQKTQIQYGREFIQMYSDMPAEMQAWVKHWSSSNPVR